MPGSKINDIAHDISPKYPRVLIVRPDRLGDVILSTALPREIKNSFPNSFVVMLVRNYAKDILSNNPFIDEIISIDDAEAKIIHWRELANLIRRRNFTHSFSLLPTERINWLLFFCGIKLHFGVGNKFYQFITNTKSVYRRNLNPLRHEADYCLDFARKIGVEVRSCDSQIFLDDSTRKFFKSEREKILGGKKYLVAIHSTYGNSTPNWKPERYKKLIAKFLSTNEISVIVTDHKIPVEINALEGVIYPDVSSQKKLVGIISICDLLISSSTGPSHVAGAVGTPTLTLFCPLPACSPTLWKPTGNKAEVILPEENYCRKFCGGNPKNCFFEGEGGIEVDSVFNKAISILKSS